MQARVAAGTAPCRRPGACDTVELTPSRNGGRARSTSGHPLSDERENARLYDYDNRVKTAFDDIVPVLKKISALQHETDFEQQAQRIAQHNTWVLISGEPGSGKEVVARYIHAHSPLRDRPFVEVAVGSMSPEHSAAELFGTEEGDRIVYGRLEQANGGTLLLGNISDMDLQTQSRLLSVFQSHSFLRMGGTEPVPIDIRVIATTAEDLEQEVQEGRFREDLYYHLNVVPLSVPPLREHSSDVPELLNYYVDRFVMQENLPYREFSIAAQNRLRNYSWPGNIRELKNLVQRLLILGQGPVIEVDEVEVALRHPEPPSVVEGASASLPLDLPLREAREQFEKVYLEHQLQDVGGSVGKLAKRVGMERTHLYRKLRALGIDFKKGGD